MTLTLKNNPLLLLGFPMVLWVVFYFVLDFDGLYGQDAYEYLRYTNALHDFVLSGKNPGDYFWPLYYPIFGAAFSFITQNTALSLLLVSVFSLSLSAFYLHKIIQALFPETKYPILYVILFYILSPYVLKHGMLVMSDMLATCFVVVTLYHFIIFKQRYIIKHFYFLTFFSVLAVMTRYATAILILPFIGLATIQFLKQKKHLVHYVLLTFTIALLLAPHFLVRHANYTGFLSHQWLQDWSLINFTKSDFTTVDGLSFNALPNIFYAFSNVFHPRYVFLGLFFIPFLFLKKQGFKHRQTIGISIILYTLFLAGIPFQNNRFLLLSFPLIIIYFYPVFTHLISFKFIRKTLFVGLFFTITIQGFLVNRAFKHVIERNRLEKDIVEILKPYQKQRLYSFDMDIAIKGRSLNFDYRNLWKKAYTDYQAGDLLLFHPTKFEKQWQGKNPMLNWDYINTYHQLKVIKACPEGWNLYKIVK